MVATKASLHIQVCTMSGHTKHVQIQTPIRYFACVRVFAMRPAACLGSCTHLGLIERHRISFASAQPTMSGVQYVRSTVCQEHVSGLPPHVRKSSKRCLTATLPAADKQYEPRASDVEGAAKRKLAGIRAMPWRLPWHLISRPKFMVGWAEAKEMGCSMQSETTAPMTHTVHFWH